MSGLPALETIPVSTERDPIGGPYQRDSSTHYSLNSMDDELLPRKAKVTMSVPALGKSGRLPHRVLFCLGCESAIDRY